MASTSKASLPGIAEKGKRSSSRPGTASRSRPGTPASRQSPSSRPPSRGGYDDDGKASRSPTGRLQRAQSASGVPRPFSLSLSETLSAPSLPIRKSVNRIRPASAVGGTIALSRSPSKLVRAASATSTRAMSRSMSAMSMTRSTSRPQLILSPDKLCHTLSTNNPELVAKARSVVDDRARAFEGIPDQKKNKMNLQKFNAWASATDQRRRDSARAAKKKEAEFEEWVSSVIADKEAKSEAAYHSWLDQKEAQAHERMSHRSEQATQKLLAEPYENHALKSALAKIIDDDLEFDTLSMWIDDMMPYGRNSKISKHTLDHWALKAALDIKIDGILAEKRRELGEDANGGGKAKKGKVQDPGAKVAKTILDVIRVKNPNFSDMIDLLRRRCTAVARGDGSISRDNVKKVLEKFEVALTPAQANDWNKSLDPGNTSAIEYGDLEDMLLDAHTATADPYAARKVVAIVDKIKKFLVKLDFSVDDLLDLIQDIADQIKTDRKNGMVDRTIGTITFLDFRAAIRALHLDELKPMQRLQLASLLDKAFNLLDPKKTRSVMHADLELFLRQLTIRIQSHGGASALQKAHTSNRKTDKIQLTHAQEQMMLRIGKVFLTNMKNNRMFGNVVTNATDMFKAIDRDGSGDITKAELRVALERMNCGLSATQEEELIGFIDRDGDGLIDVDELTRFVSNAQEALDAHEQMVKDREDPQLVLMEDFMHSVSSNAELVKNIFQDLLENCTKHKQQKLRALIVDHATDFKATIRTASSTTR